MEPKQPNFETFKTVLFKFISEHPDVDKYILFETIFSVKLLPNHFDRKKDFIRDLNEFLNRFDIRQVSVFVEYLKINNCKTLPNWLYNQKFTIDYNNEGMLDLIKKT